MRWGLCILFAALAARAGENDVQLFRLGHPDALTCTRCDGSAGDVPESGDLGAQTRFHRYASTLGLALAPAFGEPAGTLGEAGFEMGISSSQALVNIDAASWAAPSPPPSMLVVPSIYARKGLGGSLELGAQVSWLNSSQLMGLSAEVRWAVLDGMHNAPDLALRGWGQRVVGTAELDLTSAGADAQISKSFGIGGTLELQPYASAGVALVNAQSSTVNFKPAAFDNANPTAADDVFRTVSLFDNRYFRGTFGLRMVAGAVVLGAEATYAHGNNPVQHDALSPGVLPPRESLSLWSFAGQLGFRY